MSGATCSIDPPSILPAVRRMVVIGDIHGDWDATIQGLETAGIINSDLHWAAQPSSTHVIQIGDIVDRGGRGVSIGDEASERKIFDFLEKLHQEAQQVGGGVYLIMGNHELMNVMGDMRYNSPLSQNDFGGTVADRIDAFRPGGRMARQMACSMNVLMKIGSFLFVHGGILPQHCHLSINKINQVMREYLLGNMSRNPPKYFDELYMRNQGLLWSRQLAGEQVDCQLLDKPLQTYRANHIVIGHTPQAEGINSRCDSRLWRVDVGMSKALGQMNSSQILEIWDDGVAQESNQSRPFRILG